MSSDLPAILIYAGALAYGLVVGSFLNVVIHRLPLAESIVSPRSRCPACRTPIAIRDNLPVVSYLVLGGRCRSCRERISIRYPVLELLMGLLFVALVRDLGMSWAALLFMVFAALLLVAAAVDFDHQIIPDEISVGGCLVGLIATPLVDVAAGIPYPGALGQSAFGALLGAGTLWTVGFFHARLAVLSGREFPHWPGEGEPIPGPGEADYWLFFPGIGLGDVKLMAMIGAFLGPWGVLDTILAASVMGLIFGLCWGALRGDWTSPFGFGPALAAGALLSLFLPLHDRILGAALLFP